MLLYHTAVRFSDSLAANGYEQLVSYLNEMTDGTQSTLLSHKFSHFCEIEFVRFNKKIAPLTPKYSGLVYPIYHHKFLNIHIVFGDYNQLTSKGVSEIPIEYSNVIDKTLDNDVINQMD